MQQHGWSIKLLPVSHMKEVVAHLFLRSVNQGARGGDDMPEAKCCCWRGWLWLTILALSWCGGWCAGVLSEDTEVAAAMPVVPPALASPRIDFPLVVTHTWAVKPPDAVVFPTTECVVLPDQ